MNRTADIVLSSAGLIVLSPAMVAIAVAIKAADGGPVFYSQERMGKGFVPFKLYKFRTMKSDSDEAGALVTAANDQRITWIGRFLRRMKLDELPQLFNVLKGDMSVVGPRPEVYRYAAIYEEDYRQILRNTRPGLTDNVTIEYLNEEEILRLSGTPEETYIREILPAKIDIYKKQASRPGILADAGVIFRTVSRTLTRVH